MKTQEKNEEKAQGADTQEIKAKFSASFTIKAVMANAERMKANGLLNNEQYEIVKNMCTEAALRSMGL